MRRPFTRPAEIAQPGRVADNVHWFLRAVHFPDEAPHFLMHAQVVGIQRAAWKQHRIVVLRVGSLKGRFGGNLVCLLIMLHGLDLPRSCREQGCFHAQLLKKFARFNQFSLFEPSVTRIATRIPFRSDVVVTPRLENRFASSLWPSAGWQHRVDAPTFSGKITRSLAGVSRGARPKRKSAAPGCRSRAVSLGPLMPSIDLPVASCARGSVRQPRPRMGRLPRSGANPPASSARSQLRHCLPGICAASSLG
jgi:hypothetical protein